MAPTLRYFAEFVSFRGALRKNCWQSHNYGQFTISMSSSKRLQRDRATPTYKFFSRFINLILNAQYLLSNRLDVRSRIWTFDWYQNRWNNPYLRYFTEFGSSRGALCKRGWQSHNYGQLRLLCLEVNVCRGTARPPRYKYCIIARCKFYSRFINSRLNAQYLPSYRLICKRRSFLFGILKYVWDIVVKMFTFAISSPDEFLSYKLAGRSSLVFIRPIECGGNKQEQSINPSVNQSINQKSIIHFNSGHVAHVRKTET